MVLLEPVGVKKGVFDSSSSVDPLAVFVSDLVFNDSSSFPPVSTSSQQLPTVPLVGVASLSMIFQVSIVALGRSFSRKLRSYDFDGLSKSSRKVLKSSRKVLKRSKLLICVRRGCVVCHLPVRDRRLIQFSPGNANRAFHLPFASSAFDRAPGTHASSGQVFPSGHRDVPVRSTIIARSASGVFSKSDRSVERDCVFDAHFPRFSRKDHH